MSPAGMFKRTLGTQNVFTLLYPLNEKVQNCHLDKSTTKKGCDTIKKTKLLMFIPYTGSKVGKVYFGWRIE